MINIRELRIGNYVMYEQTTHVVTGLQGGLVWSRWMNGTEPSLINIIHDLMSREVEYGN